MIDGNLVIRWHDRGTYDVSLVPTGPPAAEPVPVRRVRDANELRRLLAGLGLPPDQADHAASSPYVLQSLPVRADPRVAARLGLVSTTSVRRVLSRLKHLAVEPARLARAVADWVVRSRS